jgi:hypothetical protein
MEGMGTLRVKIAKLLPETPERATRIALGPYGGIVAIHEKIWSKIYRYVAANVIRAATIKLDRHLPSNFIIAGVRAILSYESQPVSFYACGGKGHIRQSCPHSPNVEQDAPPVPDNSLAKLAGTGKPTQGKEPGENEEKKSQEAEDYQTQLKQGIPWPKLPEKSVQQQETQNVPTIQKKGRVVKQTKEDVPLVWGTLFVEQIEEQAEEMHLSTDNLSEKERAGRHEKT